jgi:hypothetical protein
MIQELSKTYKSTMLTEDDRGRELSGIFQSRMRMHMRVI